MMQVSKAHPMVNASMWALLLTALLVSVPPAFSASKDSVSNLRTEYLENPLGIDSSKPRFSWQLQSTRRDAAQSAYQLQVARTPQELAAGGSLVWDSGKIAGDQSIQVVYGGPALVSRGRYVWQVRVWDEHGLDAGVSPVASFEMGLLKASDWTASWLAPPANLKSAALLRREFDVHGAVKQARVYVTSHGLYELHLNGQRVGTDVLTPGWTSYAQRLQYQSYDVTALLKQGKNAVGAALGRGWFSGVIGFEGKGEHYGEGVALLLQLEVLHEDGHTETVNSGPDWKGVAGPIIRSEIYEGEVYDARLEQAGWALPNFDESTWQPARLIEASKDVLIAPQGPPVRRIQEVGAQRIFKTPNGDTVVDFGQNMVGWVHLNVRGPAGTVVTLRHAEVLDADGNFYTENLRTAKQQVQFTLNGRGQEQFEPHFTFQGFRYVAVDGYPGTLKLSDLTGVVVHSAMTRMSEFSTDKPLINQLQHNIIWGQKGNFVDVPTDCPQRDERLGWTGDAQVFSPTAAFNMDVAGFFSKWLKDLAADQLANGSIPFVAPDILSTPDSPQAGATGWGDAATVIPWNLYQAYGDTRLLETQYLSMQRWVDYEQARAGADNIWDGDTHFGDWLDFFSAAKNTRYGSTSTDLIATAYFARSTDILQRVAAILGRDKDTARYAAALAKIKEAFQRKFVAADGTVGEGTQTAYVLALDFDLLPRGLQAAAAAKLAADVRGRGHLTTGFLGTPHLLNMLSDYGYLKEAYALLNREEFPSWLYPVKQGATTIWERWDGRKPDGSFQNKDMNSFNHYAYGAVGDWMYETIGGIRADDLHPAYKHILIAPQPGGGIQHASTRHTSPYGEVSTDWRAGHGQFDVTVVVPPNTTATVRLPHAKAGTVKEGREALQVSSGIHSVVQQGETVAVEVGAGRYRFSYPTGSL